MSAPTLTPEELEWVTKLTDLFEMMPSTLRLTLDECIDADENGEPGEEMVSALAVVKANEQGWAYKHVGTRIPIEGKIIVGF